MRPRSHHDGVTGARPAAGVAGPRPLHRRLWRPSSNAPPDSGPSQARLAGRDHLPEALAPGLLTIPWAAQAHSDPTDLTRPIADCLTTLGWGVSARNAAPISGAARMGETPTTRIAEFAHTHALRHGTLTCLCVPHDGAAYAGVPDATATTRCRSHEDDDTSSNARVPFPDHRDHQETPAGDPALSVIWPPPPAARQTR